MKQFSGFTVSNAAFTNQMLWQQLIARLWQELGQSITGYYKYHKLIVFSSDSHLNHQIFIRKWELIEKLVERAHKTLWATVTIKDIMFTARSVVTDTGDTVDIDMWELGVSDHYDGEDL